MTHSVPTKYLTEFQDLHNPLTNINSGDKTREVVWCLPANMATLWLRQALIENSQNFVDYGYEYQ